MRISKILPLGLAASIAFSGVAMAKTVILTGDFVTENGATTQPSGMVEAKLNTKTDMLAYTVTFAGLTGPVQAAHFHGPAPMGANGGVLVPIPGPYESGLTGKTKVTPKIAKDLMEGMTYVNLHTAAYPMGEARAQMTMVTK